MSHRSRKSRKSRKSRMSRMGGYRSWVTGRSETLDGRIYGGKTRRRCRK